MKNRKILSFIVLALSLLLFMTGCSSNEGYKDFEASPEMIYRGEVTDDYIDASVSAGISSNHIANTKDTENIKSNNADNLKIITNVNLTIETVSFDESIETFEKAVKEQKGFIAQSNIFSNGGHYGNRTHRSSHHQARIPKENLEEFIKSIEDIGEITSKNTSKDDFSERYSDVESRLEVLKVKEDRILDLLSKADKMEDMIMLENTLNQTIYEKESLVKTLKGIDNKVSYSTVSVDIVEVERVEKAETVNTKFSEKVSNTFSKSMANLKKSTEFIILAVIYYFPTIILMAIIVVFGIFVIDKTVNFISKKQKNRANKKDKK